MGMGWWEQEGIDPAGVMDMVAAAAAAVAEAEAEAEAGAEARV